MNRLSQIEGTRTDRNAELPAAVRAIYPFGSHELRLKSGHSLHYLDEGSGPSLLMVHGNPTWSFYYRGLVEAFRGHYHCIVPDHLGCGLSDKPQDGAYAITDHVENLLALVRHLDLNDVTLVSHDWGGPIGFLTALSAPDRFTRFVTLNTSVSLQRLPRMLTLLRDETIGSLLIRGLNAMVRAALLAGTGWRHRIDGAVRAGYLAPYGNWQDRIAVLRFVQEIPLEPDHPNRELLAQLERELHLFAQHPHLAIWGMKDPVFNLDCLSDLQRRFPDCEVHRFDSASHLVLEEECERIIPIMREFLNRTA